MTHIVSRAFYLRGVAARTKFLKNSVYRKNGSPHTQYNDEHLPEVTHTGYTRVQAGNNYTFFSSAKEKKLCSRSVGMI